MACVGAKNGAATKAQQGQFSNKDFCSSSKELTLLKISKCKSSKIKLIEARKIKIEKGFQGGKFDLAQKSP